MRKKACNTLELGLGFTMTVEKCELWIFEALNLPYFKVHLVLLHPVTSVYINTSYQGACSVDAVN